MYRKKNIIGLTLRKIISLLNIRNLKANWGKYLFFSLIAGTFLVAIVFAWYSRNLPDPNKVQRQSGFSSEIVDRTGEEVLYKVFDGEDRKFTPIEEVPMNLRNATVAIEDKDFYKHQGFDPMAFFRIIKNVVVNRRLIGGSTLTQQLVKTVLLTNERKISRKVREFVLSVRIEKSYTKDEILQMYLNEAPYGGTAVGVASAAQNYFGKAVTELTLTECVILAGLPQSPSRYSPYSSNPKAYIPRAKDVVRRMKEDGYVTQEQETQVLSEIEMVEFKGIGSRLRAPHFVMYVKSLLEEMYGEEVLERGGLRVTTSLNWDLQERAEAVVLEEIDKVSVSLNISNGASVMMDTNTGEILSMVGSKDYFDKTIDGEVNVTTRLRQPGSSIKPLVYATAFLKGYSPSSVLADVITEFPGVDDNTPYAPKNYDGKEHGFLHLREALGSSINIPAVKLLALVGVNEVLSQGYKMGFDSLEPTKETVGRLGLSMALGGGEVRLLDLVRAYSAFANGGFRVEPVAILKIEDNKGKVIFEHKAVKKERVLDEKVAFLINDVLSDNNARLITFSPNSYLNIGSRPVAVKTGTTNDLRDNWTIGWSRDVAIGVWVGNNDNAKMKGVASGVSGAAPIWRRQMLDALSKYPDKPFDIPKGVVHLEVDKYSGYVAHDGFASYKDWFIEGLEKRGVDPIHTKIKVCKGDSSRLADSVSVSQGNYDEREVVIMKEKDPLTTKDLWQKGINEWISKQSDDIYKVPTETCNGSSAIDIQIVSPSDKSRIDGSEVTVRFEVASTKSISEARVYYDGVLKDPVLTFSPFVTKFAVTTGVHEIKVVAKNSEGKEESKTHSFAVNMDWGSPTPSPTIE